MPKSDSRRVINPKCLPMRCPAVLTLACALGLDRVHASGYAWGAIAFFLVFAWAAWIHDVVTRVDVDVLDNRRRTDL